MLHEHLDKALAGKFEIFYTHKKTKKRTLRW